MFASFERTFTIDWRAKNNPIHIALALLFLTTLALALLWPLTSGWAAREEVLGPVWYFICHRIESRCYRWGGQALPLCVRCVGMFAGLAAAALDASIRGTRGFPWRWPVALLLTAVMYGDWLLSYLTGWSHHLERLVTGFIGGVGWYLLGTLAVLAVGRYGWRLIQWLGRR